MSLTAHLRLKPGHKARLQHRNPNATPGVKSKAASEAALAKNMARLAELQYLLHAESKHAVLIVFQAMDTGGKDGTIRHVRRRILRNVIIGTITSRLTKMH
jgi:polyphosphate kinase 2 (PPK2 family)